MIECIPESCDLQFTVKVPVRTGRKSVYSLYNTLFGTLIIHDPRRICYYTPVRPDILHKRDQCLHFRGKGHGFLVIIKKGVIQRLDTEPVS